MLEINNKMVMLMSVVRTRFESLTQKVDGLRLKKSKIMNL